ncbi:uncharacterized protein [Elaeis guineensis]|uniref:uncharacterized protein n=1 Tax=Elaeis guineensis var. tenera TaxID=51953 RepID=UPI003C6D0599
MAESSIGPETFFEHAKSIMTLRSGKILNQPKVIQQQEQPISATTEKKKLEEKKEPINPAPAPKAPFPSVLESSLPLDKKETKIKGINTKKSPPNEQASSVFQQIVPSRLKDPEAPPTLELKPLPVMLKYSFLGSNDTLPVIIASDLTNDQEDKLVRVLKKHKEAIGWSIADLKGIDPSVCMHHIHCEVEAKPHRDMQRRLNPNMREVVKKEVVKWLDAGIIYPISDSQWVSPTQVVPKKSGITVVENDEGELIPTRATTSWRVCVDYRKLNVVTRKDHFPLPFIDQILEWLAGQSFFCFLDGYSRYNQIPIFSADQEKTTFTCPYGTFAFRRMPFGLCNAPATFQ